MSAVREGVMASSRSKFLNIGMLHNIDRELSILDESCFMRK